MIQTTDPLMVPIRKEIRIACTQKSSAVILNQSSYNKTAYGSYSVPLLTNMITASFRL